MVIVCQYEQYITTNYLVCPQMIRSKKKRFKKKLKRLILHRMIDLVFQDIREHQRCTDGGITFNDKFRCGDIQFTPGNFLIRNSSGI